MGDSVIARRSIATSGRDAIVPHPVAVKRFLLDVDGLGVSTGVIRCRRPSRALLAGFGAGRSDF